MGYELRLHLDQRLLDRLEALRLLTQETPAPLSREELFHRIFEEGLSALLQDLLLAPGGSRAVQLL